MVSTLLELVGFGLIVAAVDSLAGRAVAEMVAGALFVFIAQGANGVRLRLPKIRLPWRKATP